MKRSKDWSPAQPSLLPPSPMDWLKEDHLVYFLLDLLPTLDLREIEAVIHAKDARGTRPYNPRMMVGLLLYGYCVGVVSSRKLEQATYENVAFRVLCADNHPDHSAISNFRKTHLAALGNLFHQILQLCSEAGLVKLGHVALDGTKLKANASKHKANSYAGLEKNEERLLAEIKDLLRQAEEADEAEDAKYGKDRTGDELPDELIRRSDRLRAIQEAKAALEAGAALTKALEKKDQAVASAEKAEAKGPDDEAAIARAERAEALANEAANEALEQAANLADEAAKRASELKESAVTAAEKAEAARAAAAVQKAEEALAATEALLCDSDDQGDDDQGLRSSGPDLSMPSRRVKARANGEPVASAQRSFTDPDSQLMKDGTGYSQAYNCQAAVDEEHQVIVAAGLSNQANDSPHLIPMLGAVIENCGAAPETFTADAGYSSEENLAFCEEAGTDAYIPSRRKTRPKKEGEAKDTPVTSKTPRASAMDEKLRTDEGRKKYRRRKFVGEAPFGNIKAARGFTQFLLRGLHQVPDEWKLICTGHNLLKLFRAKAGIGGKVGSDASMGFTRSPACPPVGPKFCPAFLLVECRSSPAMLAAALTAVESTFFLPVGLSATSS